jgi:biotin transport system substrate-specific component
MSATTAKIDTLTAHLWPATTRRAGALRTIVLVGLGAGLLTLSAKVQVPFYPVPMTLQTLVVLLIGAAFGWRLGVAAVALYLAQGLAGLPVFANTPPLMAGPLYLFGPTGGFLVGFLVATAIVGWAAERGWDRSAIKLALAMMVADALLLALGALWLAFFAALPGGATGVGLGRAWAAGVQPFLLGEALKVAIAALAVPATWRLLARLRG